MKKIKGILSLSLAAALTVGLLPGVKIASAEENEEKDVTVKVTVLGDEKHGDNGVYHSYDKTLDDLKVWVDSVECTAKEGDTVMEIIEKLFADINMDYEISYGSYISSINGLAGYDNGDNSSWLFLFNGAYGYLSIAEQTVTNGDEIIFHYTDNWADEDFSRGPSSSDDNNGSEETTVNAEDAYKETGDNLIANVAPTVGSIGGDWSVIGLARSGRTDSTYAENYYNQVVELLDAAQSNKLSSTKSTDNSRVIIALTALGYDATDVNGYDLTEPLTDIDFVEKQGINGAMYALIALNGSDYSLSSTDEKLEVRKTLVDYLLSLQLSDGGFTLSGDEADPDVTAMAIQALTPAYKAGDETVKSAVDKALSCLSNLQNEDGSYSSYGSANAESISQVIIALSGLGIDASEDAGFVKTNGSALTALCSFYLGDGTFEHAADGGSNQMATEQAYLALTAYYRMKNGEADLYDMTASSEEPSEPSKDDSSNNDENNNPADDTASSEDKAGEEDNASTTDGSTTGASDNASGASSVATPVTGDNVMIFITLAMLSGVAGMVTMIKRKSN